MEASELIDKAASVLGGFPELADRVAYSERTLKRVRSGEVPLSSKLEQLLDKIIAEERPAVLNSTARGDSPGRLQEQRQPNVDPALIQLRRIPVYSFVKAGKAEDFEMLPPDWEDEVAYLGNDPKAFGLRIVGDSMEPKYSPGDIVVVSPRNPPSNGDRVVAKVRNQGVLFKIMHHSGDGSRIMLSSYNPLYKEQEFAREDLHWMYPVKQVIKP